MKLLLDYFCFMFIPNILHLIVLKQHLACVVQTAISALQSVLQEDFKATEIEV